MNLQAPWIGNPDYGRDFKREQELHEEEIQEIERKIESNNEDIFELKEDLKKLEKDSEEYLDKKEEINFLKYLNNELQNKLEELEEE